MKPPKLKKSQYAGTFSRVFISCRILPGTVRLNSTGFSGDQAQTDSEQNSPGKIIKKLSRSQQFALIKIIYN